MPLFSSTIRCLLLLLCLGLSCSESRAQLSLAGGAYLEGTVTDLETDQPLAAISVTNLTHRQSAFTGADGSYRIAAQAGDRIRFTHISYQNKTIDVAATGRRDVALSRSALELSEVIVRPKWTPYQADSVRRHSTYQRILSRRPTTSLMSPVSLIAEKFNKRSRQIRRFQKDFYYWEDQRFVETRYTPELVASLIPLSGDSLTAFINAYPMPYDYARTAGDIELKMWIRTNYREWMKKPYVPELPPVSDSSAVIPQRP